FTNINAGLIGIGLGSGGRCGIAWGDYDNDGDLDLAAAGDYGPSGIPGLSKIYRNNGGGSFTDTGAGIINIAFCSVAWGDYDNDGDLDLVVAGSTGEATLKLYRNDMNARFTVKSRLLSVNASSAAWGDYDKDGDLDLLISGAKVPGGQRTNIIYRNNNGNLVNINANLMGVSYGSVAWGDYDNDGDLDLACCGMKTGSSGVTNIIYRNTGGRFTNILAGLIGLSSSSCAWGDYDNDGDLDLAAAGMKFNGVNRTNIIYRNDGNGVFVNINAGLVKVYGCSVTWADYDNDADLDLVVAGNSLSGKVTKIYRNNGGGNFSDVGAGLIGVDKCSTAWGDYDNDGDLDLALAGESAGGNTTRIYRNDGSGSFMDIGAGLTGVSSCNITWGDYDNDGDLDLLVAGDAGASTYTSILYRNNGDGSFTDAGAGLLGVSYCSIAWGDYDNDGYQDLAVAGLNAFSSLTNILYKNMSFTNVKQGLPNDQTWMSFISNQTPGYPADNQYTFKYRIRDNESDKAKIVKVQYSVDNRKWQDADVSGTLDNITTSSGGTVNYFSWNANAIAEDLVAGQNVLLRVLTTSYFSKKVPSADPIRSAGPILYGSHCYQLSVPIRVNGAPQCKITSPVSVDTPYDKVSGTVNIYGYAYDDNFSGYQLYYGAGVNPSAWVQFGTSTSKVPPFEQLGTLNTASLANGTYSLRITANDTTAKTRDSWSNVNNRVRIQVVNVPAAASSVNNTYPTNNQQDVALNTPVIVRFSDKLNPNTVTPSSIRLYDGVDYVSGLIHYNDFNQCLIFTPDNNLSGNRDYVAFVSSELQNIYGIPMGRENTFKFRTTVYYPDKVSSVYPAATQPDVELDPDIRIRYSDGTLSGSSFSNGMEIRPVMRTPVPDYSFAGYSNSGFIAEYTNTTGYLDNTVYIVTLKPQILDKGYYTWYFVTRDTIQCVVDTENSSPGPDETFVDLNKKIAVRFNKSMNYNMLTTGYVYLLKGADKVNCKVTYSEADREAYITPIEPLEQFTLYTIFVSGEICDFGGMELGRDYQWSFRTAVIVNKDGARVSTADGKLDLVIGPHALDYETTVQISRLDCTAVPVLDKPNCTLVCGAIYRFDPVGTKLKKRITVSIGYGDTDITGMDESRLSLYCYRSGQWERIGGTVDRTKNRVDAVIDEFSVAALVEDKNDYSGELEKVIVDCQPRVFDPGEWVTARISFELPKQARYSVMVYNMAGKLVDVLAENVQGVPGQNVVYWDGRNLKGKKTPNSMYIIALVIDDSSKKVKKTKTVVVLEN
ncbi:MAG: FG-GAP-like repeat-containing protein, partial [bacterium]|nr:FG-GAP-like repeat-containing protein [bacterium]